METIQIDADSLYHYTDIGAIASIVKNKMLWLSNTAFQNDSQEMLEGYAFLQKRIEIYKDYLDDKDSRRSVWVLEGVLSAVEYIKHSHITYTCSFSRAPDLLSQWRAYGSFAVEFSRSALSEEYALYDCLYESDMKVKKADKVLNDYFVANKGESRDAPTRSLTALRSLMEAMATFKSQHFEAEHEVRMIETGVTEVLHRARGTYLIPYVQLGFSVDAIKSIHIGPVANPDLTEASIRSLLISCGLRDVPVVQSRIPYRS